MSKSNIDAWRRQIRADRQQRLNAICPHCNTGLLKELESAVGKDTQRKNVLLNCPTCKAELEFQVHWIIEPYYVSTTPAEEEPQEDMTLDQGL